jgi:predicted ATPase/DNA-binding SARP family transcriptional activator
MSEAEYRVLGPVELLRNGEAVSVGGSTALTLLAGLLLSANQVVPGERLTEIVWGERQPARPRNALHSAISRLRRTVGSEALERLPTGYRLRVGVEELDLLRSDRLVAAADAAQRSGRLDEAAAALNEALGLWRDLPLGNVDSAALNAEAARLAEKHLALHERHAELCLRLGRHAAVVEMLPPLVEAQPFRERLVSQLMLALLRSGRQAEALAAYETLSTALHDELGIRPSAWLRDLHVRILRADLELENQLPPMPQQREAQAPGASSAGPKPRWRGLRAPAQRLVGRDQEVEELYRTVLKERAVTLVGAAGVGKTAVALKAAERLAAEFRNGVAVVEFGSLAATGNGGAAGEESGTTVPEALRSALSVQPASGLDGEEELTAALGQMELLLLLDTAEHVADDCGRVVDLIVRSCPGIRVLTTSRRPLGIGAEAVVELSPLEPALAVGLLRLRTTGHRPRLDLDADPEGLAELCRQVDGLPLAVELAALRLRTMSLRALLRRIGRPRGLLAGPNGARFPHQRALDTSLQWSYELLSRSARLLLHRLAHFEGCFTLEQAEQSSGYPPLSWHEVAGLLGGLVEQCMVQAIRGGGGYAYRLLIPVRRFVLDLPAPFDVPALNGGYRRALTLVCAHGSAG